MKRPVWMVLVGVVVALAAVILLRRIPASRREPLEVLGQVPAFRLLASDGSAVSEAQFAGKIWVADFVFTTCPGICPILSAQMSKLAHATATNGNADVRLVSFSVDPAKDTPEALRAYAERYHADPQRWSFLTGSRAALYEIIGNGFHLAVADRTPAATEDANAELITHSDRFVLVDPQLRIRAYYHGTDEGVVSQVMRDIQRLRQETSAPK